MIYIDGSLGEGGGQIIRTAVSLAAITGQTVEIAHIRARRSKPGLQAQHLTAVRAAGTLCDAQMYGAELGSQYLHFVPGSSAHIKSLRALAFDVAEARGGASAGATGLVAQTLLVPLAVLERHISKGANSNDTAYNHKHNNKHNDIEDTDSGIQVTVQGGTHVPMSPTSDYLEAVYLPTLQRMGMKANLDTRRAGFFPKGGGEIVLTLHGGGLLNPIDLVERGRLQRLIGYITTSQLPEHVAIRAEELMVKELKGFGVPIQIEKRDLDSHGAGAAVCLVAECQQGRAGWLALGERGKPMERVATETIRGFREWQATGATVDEHLADQLVLPCALIPEESRWITPTITDHLRTVLHITAQFLPVRYTLTEREDGTGMVTMRGASVG